MKEELINKNISEIPEIKCLNKSCAYHINQYDCWWITNTENGCIVLTPEGKCSTCKIKNKED
jgi:hypothetical protein